jgi:hypothetical protein
MVKERRVFANKCSEEKVCKNVREEQTVAILLREPSTADNTIIIAF